MKDDLAGAGDLFDVLRAVTSVGFRQAEHLVVADPRFRNGDDIFFRQVSDLLVQRGVARMRGGKSCRIGKGPVLAKNRFVENWLWKLGTSRSRHGNLPPLFKFRPKYDTTVLQP